MDPVAQLGRTLDQMSPATLAAMLEGVERYTIVAGAYTSGDGTACPLLAAHRSGAPASSVSHRFPEVWDQLCRIAPRSRMRELIGSTQGPRACSEREVALLRSMIERRLFPRAERCDGCGSRRRNDLHGGCVRCGHGARAAAATPAAPAGGFDEVHDRLHVLDARLRRLERGARTAAGAGPQGALR